MIARVWHGLPPRSGARSILLEKEPVFHYEVAVAPR
jgi:hypothetical protein